MRVELEGEMATKFEAIKREKGIENNTDVIRSLISDEFKRLPKADR